MHASDLRHKILSSSTRYESEDTFVYENDHIQKLFLRTVETGLQDENVRVRVRGGTSETPRYQMWSLFCK
jgi:chemotaxis receptor (MCP) glutamine deamidase CheD